MEHLMLTQQPTNALVNWISKAFQVCLLLFFVQYNLTAKANTYQDSIPGEIHRIVDQLPEFSGGKEALFKFLAENLNMPYTAAEHKVFGQVVVKFVVFKDGTIGNIGIMKSLAPAADEEAIRVVKAMPKWIPGQLKGADVNVEMGLPIRFDYVAIATLEKDKLICDGVEKAARFPGEEQALFRYMARDIKYPELAKYNKTQGNVVVQFFIEKDGSITHPEITSGLADGLNEEVIRMLNKMPKWEPSLLNGEPVRTFVREFAVVFRIM